MRFSSVMDVGVPYLAMMGVGVYWMIRQVVFGNRCSATSQQWGTFYKQLGDGYYGSPAWCDIDPAEAQLMKQGRSASCWKATDAPKDMLF